MIAALTQSFLAAVGFGSVVCLNRDGPALAAELRNFGIYAVSEIKPSCTFDFAVIGEGSLNDAEVRDALEFVRKAVVLLLPAHVDLNEYLTRFSVFGFRIHPRTSIFDLISLRYELQIVVVERVAESDVFEDVQFPTMATSLLAEIATLVQYGDRVLVVGDQAHFSGHVIAANSLPTAVVTVLEDGPFDMGIITVVGPNNVDIPLIIELSQRLNPGGRIVVAILSFERKEVIDNTWFSSRLPPELIPDALYVPDEGPKLLRDRLWARYDVCNQRYWIEGWQAISVMKSPLSPGLEDPYSDFVEFAFDDLSNQYANPRLVRSMVSIPSRLASICRLEELANDVLARSSTTADLAAATCVKGYIFLGQERGWEEISLLLQSFDRFTSIDENTDGIGVRWATSLLYVKALLERKYGHIGSAKRSFERCARSPFLRFAPMLGTKTVSACQQLALMSLAEGDISDAEKWLQTGVALSCDAWNSQLKARSLYPSYVLPEIAQVIGLGAQCNAGLLALRRTGDSAMIWSAMKCDLSSQVLDERILVSSLRDILRTKL